MIDAHVTHDRCNRGETAMTWTLLNGCLENIMSCSELSFDYRTSDKDALKECLKGVIFCSELSFGYIICMYVCSRVELKYDGTHSMFSIISRHNSIATDLSPGRGMVCIQQNENDSPSGSITTMGRRRVSQHSARFHLSFRVCRLPSLHRTRNFCWPSAWRPSPARRTSR